MTKYRIKELDNKFFIQFESSKIIRGGWGINRIKKWETYESHYGEGYDYFRSLTEAKEQIEKLNNPSKPKYHYL